MKKITLVVTIIMLSSTSWAQTNTFPSSGNVGIGTTTPSSFGTSQPTLELKGGTIYRTGAIRSNSSDMSRGWYLGRADDSLLPDGLVIGITDSNNINFRIAANNLMTLNTSGYLGLATTTPLEAFQIGDRWTFHNGGHKIIGYNYDYNSGDKRIVEDESSVIRFTDEGDMRFLTSGSDIAGSAISWSNTLILKNDGKIGIGTLTPVSHLDVNGDIAIKYGNVLRVNVPDGNSGNWTSASNRTILKTSWSLNLGDYLDIKVPGAVANNALMRFTKNGRLGIGTENPDAELAVNGTIHAKEVKVDLNGWSDFVFNENYNLRTLEATEQYISENNHLPDIPSEAEVKENGINLGEMDAKLLQKIEELTMYMIEMNKSMVELRARNEQLEKKVAALDGRK